MHAVYCVLHAYMYIELTVPSFFSIKAKVLPEHFTVQVATYIAIPRQELAAMSAEALCQASMANMNTADLFCLLEEAGVHEDVTRSFTENRINGMGFLSLTEEDLKELVPVIGDRISVRKLKENFKKEPRQQEQVTGMHHTYVANDSLASYNCKLV